MSTLKSEIIDFRDCAQMKGRFYMTISQRIFIILKEKGKKQKELSQYTGISEQTISDWKKKGSIPSADKISGIADFLEVSTDYLLTGEEQTISKITQSTIGAVGNHSTGTVNVQSKDFSNSNSDFSVNDETAQEITRILNKLSLKERSKLLTMIYDFEEECDKKSKK